MLFYIYIYMYDIFVEYLNFQHVAPETPSAFKTSKDHLLFNLDHRGYVCYVGCSPSTVSTRIRIYVFLALEFLLSFTSHCYLEGDHLK